MAIPAIPITTLGGYLGAGKTTLLNALLSDPGGRRLGVVVNDFGALPVDADRLERTAGGVISLPNGCVCCSLGTDLFAALGRLASLEQPPDHIVIEASGVADPAVAAAWGTSAGFEPGGVVVLAAADSVEQQANDKYVGGEVRRQLVGADLIIISKVDLCTDDGVDRVQRWLRDLSDAPTLTADRSTSVPAAVVLGVRPAPVLRRESTAHDALDRYVAWNVEIDTPVRRSWLDAFLVALPDGLLRMKGFVDGGVSDHHFAVDVVGRTVSVVETHGGRPRSELVGIGVRDVLDTELLDRTADVLRGSGPMT